MYIERIRLENIRCFEKLQLEFGTEGSTALFLGDNGDGKSTVLRCLAMGLCDQSSAAALFRELSGSFVRNPPGKSSPPVDAKGIIEIDLVGEEGARYRITTKIASLPDFEQVTQDLTKIVDGKPIIIKPKDFPWEHIFVVAYGPGLRTRGTQDYQKYLAVDAVYPLFRYDTPLQNPELIIRRLVDSLRDRASTPEFKNQSEVSALRSIQSLMTPLLDLESPESFQLLPTGLAVNGFWGTAGLSQLGDGFQATITWVLDLISWWFLRESARDSSVWNFESIEGIVIIDEIEQHLHPRWQHRILPLLREQLPNVQFIVSTHSPLVASSSEEVDVHLFKKGQQQKVRPYGWLAENVYEIMGLEESRSDKFNNDVITSYAEVDLKKINGTATPSELARWRELNTVLASLPEGDPVGLSLEIANIVKSLGSDKGVQA